VTLHEVAPGDWDALLAELGVEDGYLRRASVEASSLLEPATAVFLADDEVALPVLLREIPGGDGLRDVSAPYPCGGPVARAGAAEPFWAAYADWCRERSVITTFIRFHPLLQNQRLAPADAVLERLADAAVWRLEGDLFAGLHRSHRNKCRKARAAGVEVSAERAPASLDGFLELHEETMRRQGASGFYAFGPPYWEKLLELGDGLVRLDARLEGELVASEVCVAGGTWLHYHMGVTADRGRELGAANLLVYETAVCGQANGFTELSLGSGVGGQEDSLWEFKQRFAPDMGRELWIGKLVNDEDAYLRLGGDPAAGGFFPAYRAPDRSSS
jgi:Acetyltransferase (GNAT) domain